jgi:hypothetical protein
VNCTSRNWKTQQAAATKYEYIFYFWYMHKQKLQIKENGLLPVKGVDNEKIAIYHVIVFYCNFLPQRSSFLVYFY